MLSKAPGASQGQTSTAGCTRLVVFSAALEAMGITLQLLPAGALLFPQLGGGEELEESARHWAAGVGGRIRAGAPRKQSQALGADVGALWMRRPHIPLPRSLQEPPAKRPAAEPRLAEKWGANGSGGEWWLFQFSFQVFLSKCQLSGKSLCDPTETSTHVFRQLKAGQRCQVVCFLLQPSS